jgi:hypothetical protein
MSFQSEESKEKVPPSASPSPKKEVSTVIKPTPVIPKQMPPKVIEKASANPTPVIEEAKQVYAKSAEEEKYIQIKKEIERVTAYKDKKGDTISMQEMVERSSKSRPMAQDYIYCENGTSPISYAKQSQLNFPTTPLLYTEANFSKVDVDTLFFMFYMQQGSYFQHMASIELKQRKWLYNKKYASWFQKIDENSYYYFDFENNWEVRRKNDYILDYSSIECDNTISN